MNQRLLLIPVALIFFTMLATGLALKNLAKPITLESPQVFDVIYGDSIHKVAQKMHERGYLDHPKLLIIYSRLFSQKQFIKAGEYEVLDQMSALEIFDAIQKGHVISRSVTLIEGWTSQQAIEALHKAKGIVKTVEANDSQAILKALRLDQEYPFYEGVFYPDTYHYSKGTKDLDILKTAADKMRQTLAEAWANKESNLPYKSAYEALIMASIVERETSVGQERAQIAGVFVERLNRGMRLQTDPTVIYGMGDSYNGNIRRKDLLTPTPYNTYTIKGMPPTPIALPTQASIQASLHPLLNGKLYFVAKGDGYHYFSDNLPEHQNAVREFQLKRRSNYRSAPAK